MTYDLVIKDGMLIDPSQGLHAKKDIAISGGAIRAVEDSIRDGDASDVIEANGLIDNVDPVQFAIRHCYRGRSCVRISGRDNCDRRRIGRLQHHRRIQPLCHRAAENPRAGVSAHIRHGIDRPGDRRAGGYPLGKS